LVELDQESTQDVIDSMQVAISFSQDCHLIVSAELQELQRLQQVHASMEITAERTAVDERDALLMSLHRVL
jgi:hypothetical protein